MYKIGCAPVGQTEKKSYWCISACIIMYINKIIFFVCAYSTEDDNQESINNLTHCIKMGSNLPAYVAND